MFVFIQTNNVLINTPPWHLLSHYDLGTTARNKQPEANNLTRSCRYYLSQSTL